MALDRTSGEHAPAARADDGELCHGRSVGQPGNIRRMPGEAWVFPALLVDGHRFEWVSSTKVTVGRDADSDVVVDGPRVSRTHLVIEADERGWVVRDAASRNGTFLDGTRVAEILLEGPLELALGSATEGTGLRVELVAAPAPVAPVNVAPTQIPPVQAQVPTQDPMPAGPAEVYGHGSSATRPGVAVPQPRLEEQPKSVLGRFQAVHRPPVGRFRIGRAADNDLALEGDPRASRYHAELRRLENGRVEIVDLDSHNGTFVNGQRVSRAVVNDGDVVAVGNHVFQFHNGGLVEFAQSDEADLEVAGVRVVIGGSTLLDAISFSLKSRSMLAVVGPSGAGKTTLLRALTGFSRPTQGAITFGGRDLYADYDELRARIGYVSQDDLVHEQLTVRQELEFAGALRLPPDLGHAGLSKRADEVMAELGLTARADLQIEKLSGGQRKRVSVGVELLTEPALLYLDEPTSGLDPGNERQVMQVLRKLADGGRIVVVVTHSTQSLDVADRVLFLARGGHMAYYGPPQDAQRFFENHGVVGGWPAVFQALEGDDGRVWGERFRQDPDFGRYVGAIAAAGEAIDAHPRPAAVSTAHRRARLVGPVGGRRQTVILCRRQLRLIAGDRRSVILLAAQAPMFALILTFLFPAHTLSSSRGPFAALLEWLLVVSTTWLGASNTIREIVKEQAVYRRERAGGLSMLAYVGSKVIVFGVITIVQSFILLVIVLLTQSLPPEDPTHIVTYLHNYGAIPGLRPFTEGSVISSQPVEVFAAMALAGLAGMAIGLFVSSAVRKSDQAVFMLPVILIVEMALSQPMLQLQNTSAALKVLGALTSADWGVDAVGSTTSLNQLMTSYTLSLNRGTDQVRDALGFHTSTNTERAQTLQSIRGNSSWAHTPGTWVFSMFILLLMTLLLFGLVALMMRRLDTGNPRSLFEDIRGYFQTRKPPAAAGSGRPFPQRGGPGAPVGRAAEPGGRYQPGAPPPY
jgi:ABC-type multidrug transport system ATPase subunit